MPAPRLTPPYPHRIYIAGPMTGIEKYNYPAFFEAACQLALAGYEPVNPATIGVQKGQPYEFYIESGMKMLLQSDAVAVLPGWEESNGAKLEIEVAYATGMRIAPVDEWLQERNQCPCSHVLVDYPSRCDKPGCNKH
jgi:hypothetical protein